MTVSFISLAASGPVRLFTPYKRRRRNQLNAETTIVGTTTTSAAVAEGIQAKVKKTAENDGDHIDQSIVTKEESTWESIADGIDASTEYIDSTSQSNLF